MGVKMFTCSVCGEEVSRPKSYALPNGTRACREHEEAQSGRKELQKREDAKKAAARKKQPRRTGYSRPLDDPAWGINHCWSCGDEGTPTKQVQSRMMVAMEKLRLRPEMDPLAEHHSPLSPDFWKELRKEAKVDNPLVGYPIPPERMDEILNRTKFKQRMVINILGFTQLCPKCATNLSMKLMELPEINLEQAAMFGAVYDVVVRPEVEKIAHKEILDEIGSN